jgi:DNA processing protein
MSARWHTHILAKHPGAACEMPENYAPSIILLGTGDLRGGVLYSMVHTLFYSVLCKYNFVGYCAGMDTAYPVTPLPEDRWPTLIHEINDPPKSLYVRGSLAPLDNTHQKILAVVGSRRMTTYGKRAVEVLVSGLQGYPVTIVSGLAIGIDALAHQTALDVGLHTVSVPGSGIADTVIYPARHKVLAKRILDQGGALLSEFEPEFRATTWSFPARNRIMAGMSHAVLIVEAHEKSGTLITARLATDYNRDVLAVPGSIFDEGSAGTHMLIERGAVPIISPTALIEALGFNIDHSTPCNRYAVPPLSDDEQKLYNILSEPKTRDQICAQLDIIPSHVNILISMLEMKGVVRDQYPEIHRTTFS